MSSDVILVIVVVTALAFDFTNGFHDTANAVATSVSTRSLTPRIALGLAAVMNLLGGFAGVRALQGLLTLFLAFLMREHPLPGWSGPAVLAMVAGAAGVGNALGSVIGNRRRSPAPERLATVVAGVAVLAALLTAVFYSLPTLVLLGLATGLFGQLAKLSLDALIQRDVDDHVQRAVESIDSLRETRVMTLKTRLGNLGNILDEDPTQCDMLMLNLHRMNPKKYLYELYSERVASMRLLPFDPEWDGATNFETK